MENTKQKTTEIYLASQALLKKMDGKPGDNNQTFDSGFARILNIERVELTKGNVGTIYFSMVMP